MNRESQYWIKAGIVVYSTHWPDIKMVVDGIKRHIKEFPKKIDENLIKDQKVMVDGVKTHWITKDGIYQTGVFQTTELREWTKE